ncbi:phage baseplate assembly protein V [Caulobacter sp. BE254]|uniref:phage baseplate assembly protein V n=1 Tax=Caulobacter sp. BE254 TaxID=2817720 RepID=UPI0028628ED9|nr:phage baseplate assembly protein V [Caulobacter sp. BE254]MDR7115591.1 uncharacterized protein involved in type VI secretion and phage assembly [Caulobacter sp. BE254]
MSAVRHLEALDGGAAGLRHFGLHPAIVRDIVDPDNLGRVKVGFPWMGEAGTEVSAWARLVSLYADDDQGWLIVPAVDSEVVVAFEAGRVDRPYVVGAVWNGREALPDRPVAANNKRLLKTRSGSLLEFDDTDGTAKVTLSMQSGHRLVLEDSPQQITLRHAGGSEIVIDPAGKVNITTSATVEVNATALNVHAAAAVFDGTITCTTMTASVGVVSPSYTPGAGNVW